MDNPIQNEPFASGRIAMNVQKRIRITYILMVSLASSGCVYHAAIPDEKINKIYMVQSRGDDAIARFAPVFLTYDHRNDYNLIGRPTAEYDECGRESIYVNKNEPVIYYRVSRFTTPKGVYTNYIYRVHFPEVPFSFFPFHLTAGKNVGLMVFVTLDRNNRPVLVTTVHTCGCYASIVPTSYLPRDAFPEDWEDGPLDVYGETLPGKLNYNEKTEPGLLVHVRPGVHRVMDLEIIDAPVLFHAGNLDRTVMELQPMDGLDRIPINGKTTSFYHKEGLLKGHVKGSIKYWETLLMGLISLDLFVGTDKAYDDTDLTENPFYTSLKIWNRNASDIWHFERFLEFWGWRL